MHNALETKPGGKRIIVTAAVALVALHVAKTCAFVAVGQPAIYGDPLDYWHAATRMASGDWLMVRGDVETIRTPGYPCFLALLQLAFGRHAMIAAIVCQQLMVLLSAIVAAWMCRRISGSWLGGLIGLALGLFCFSQNAVAGYLLSDTLFELLLTLSFAALVAWLDRPAAKTAAAIGLLLGLATLVRPLTQFAWAPFFAAMAFRLSADLNLRRLAVHAACLFGIFAAVLSPWYARNYCYCGQPFFSKTAGLTMWQSLFRGNSAADPAVPFADTPKTRAVLARLEGVELQGQAEVLKALEEQHLTRLEAIDQMQGVCIEAIRAHPWQFLSTRLRHFAWFWVTPNGTRRPLTQEVHAHEDEPAAAPGLVKPFPWDYCGQAHWHWDGYYREGKLNWLWWPNVWLYFSTAVLAACGVATLFMNRRPAARPIFPGNLPHERTAHGARRAVAVEIALMMLYVSTLTVLGGRPEYRFRMILEPIMLVSIALLAEKVASRFLGQGAGSHPEGTRQGARSTESDPWLVAPCSLLPAPGSMLADPQRIYNVLFPGEIPSVLASRFTHAWEILAGDFSAQDLSQFRIAISGVSDLEALELACRRRKRLPVLTAQVSLMVMLAETLPSHSRYYLDTRPTRAGAIVSIVAGLVRTAWKLFKGSFLLGRIHG
jgi:hypothetical protein